MEIIDLNKLKEANAEAEAQPKEEIKAEEVNEEAEDAESTEEAEEEAEEAEAEEESEEDAEAEEIEAWQQSEGSDDSQDGGFIPNPAAKKLRLKAKALKEQVKEKDSEVEQLRKELEALKSGSYQFQQPQPELKRPKLEDFDYDDEKYTEALEDYFDKKVELKLSQGNQKAMQESAQKALIEKQQQAVEKHYEKALELVEKSNSLTEEAYQKADSSIRRTIESALPNMGDVVADQLIARLVESGEGSEKAWFYLGNNSTQLEKLQQKLKSDPSGLSAAIFMGELRAKATTPIRVKSKSPSPAPRLKGDSKAATSLKRAYNKSTDVSERIELKKKAKARGEDTSNW